MGHLLHRGPLFPADSSLCQLDKKRKHKQTTTKTQTNLYVHINKYINENKQIDIKIILAPRSGHEGRECMVEACSSWLWHWEHVTLTVHMTWDQEAKRCSQELQPMSASYAAACPHSSQPPRQRRQLEKCSITWACLGCVTSELTHRFCQRHKYWGSFYFYLFIILLVALSLSPFR